MVTSSPRDWVLKGTMANPNPENIKSDMKRIIQTIDFNRLIPVFSRVLFLDPLTSPQLFPSPS
jgi:hypothetical protein